MTNSEPSFSEKIDQMLSFLAEQSNLERQRHEQTMVELRELTRFAERNAQASERNAQASEAQRQSIEQFAASFGGLARLTVPLPQKMDLILDATRRATQASEVAAFSANRTLEAVREMQDQLKQGD